MPWGLTRFHHSRQSHFVTFCCYHRRRLFTTPDESSRQGETSHPKIAKSGFSGWGTRAGSGFRFTGCTWSGPTSVVGTRKNPKIDVAVESHPSAKGAPEWGTHSGVASPGACGCFKPFAH